jgi:hypothetical protein
MDTAEGTGKSGPSACGYAAQGQPSARQVAIEHTSITVFIVIHCLAFERNRGLRVVKSGLAAILIFDLSSRASKSWLLAEPYRRGSKLLPPVPFSSRLLPDPRARPGWPAFCNAKVVPPKGNGQNDNRFPIKRRNTIMITGKQTKCAYERCECAVNDGKRHCSDYCADADADHEIEIQCDCKHAPCSLT